MSKNSVSGAALLVAAACMALAVAAAEATTGTTQHNGNANGAGGGTANSGGSHAGHMTSDMKFATEAAIGGMEEVQLGQLAAQKGTSDEVRQFGQRMVDDHTRANQELMQLASSKGMTLPAALDPKHQSDVQKLSAMSGEAFDRAYVKMMVKDHRKDVGEFQKQSARGADADLKSFAARTLPTLQEHLQMIQRIDDKMKLRRSGNLTNSNSGGGMGSGGNSNMGGGMNSNSGGGMNSNSNRGRGRNRNSNSNSNTGSNSNSNR